VRLRLKAFNPSLAALKDDFWKFWLGQTISNLGSSFTTFTLPLLVFKLTGSAINLAIASAACYLPYLLFGLVIGAWVDRTDRKKLMILSDVVRAAAIAILPCLALVDRLSVWSIYAVLFISSTVSIYFDSAQFAAIPSLVRQEDLVSSNGRLQASYSAASIVGPLLGGVLVAWIPIETLLLFDALSFLISAFSLMLINRSFNAVGKREVASIRADVIEGLRYVLHQPVLRAILGLSLLLNLLAGTLMTQLVLFAKERLQASDTQFGFLYAASSLGVVLVSLAAGPLRRSFSFSALVLGGPMLNGFLIMTLAFTRSYWIALPLWALISSIPMLFVINTNSLRQTIVPNHMLGRVQSIAAALAWSVIPLGNFLGGFLIEWTQNVALIYGLFGLLNFLFTFAFIFTALARSDRHLPRRARESEREGEEPPIATWAGSATEAVDSD
jgi:MFS family permease